MGRHQETDGRVQPLIDNGDKAFMLNARRELLKVIFGVRAPEGQEPETDLEVLQPEFVKLSDDEVLTVRIPIKRWMGNGLNVVQGGVLTYMIDAVVGPLGYAYSETDLSGTVDLSTSYVRPVTRDDAYVTVVAKIRSNTRRMAYIEAELFTADGKLAATAVTNIMKGRKKPE